MLRTRFPGVVAVLFALAAPLVAQPATGTIAGTVTLKGTAPAPRFLERESLEGCPDRPLVDQSRLVSAGGRVPWAFLWIARGKLPESTAPETSVSLTVSSCQFLPHVVGLRKGQTLVLHSEDAVDHAIHAITRAGGGFQEVLPAGGDRTWVPQEAALLAPISCAEHPWMRSTLWVIDHPYFAVSDGQGSFRIEGVPPGTYAVAIGHESFHGLGKLVQVEAGETSRLEFFVTDPAAPVASGP